jgi:cyclophilin family peptidyl-prolyl cis-trans isomerase
MLRKESQAGRQERREFSELKLGAQIGNQVKGSWGCAGKYTVFGHVIDGMDVLDRMEKVPTGAGDRPVNEIRLERITIHANPLAG